MLLERPREVVTREELRERLWLSDTFVDFDHGLNTAINQLRNALGDSAANPRFIQTLPRRGYRFIAPVETGVDVSTASTSPMNGRRGLEETLLRSSDPEPPVSQPIRSSILSDPQDLPPVSSGVVRVLFSLIQLMYLIFYIVSMAQLSKVEAILTESGNPTVLVLVVLI